MLTVFVSNRQLVSRSRSQVWQEGDEQQALYATGSSVLT